MSDARAARSSRMLNVEKGSYPRDSHPSREPTSNVYSTAPRALIDLAATVCGALVRTLYEQHARTQSDFDLEARRSRIFVRKYPRDHTWIFDGGHTMTATAAPAYLGSTANVDPEEAFVASLSSCHMLTFLAIACKQKFVLDSYEDEAVGHMEKNAEGKMAITRVELRPKITWGGDRKPTAEQLDQMHHAAHDNCFIANSVRTNVTVVK